MIRFSLVLAVPLAVLAACGDAGRGPGPGGSADAHLDGTSWIATSVTEGGRPRALVAGSELRIGFHDHSISINAGCNSMGADYTVTGGELRVGQLVSTMMACAQPLMDQDRWLLATVFAAPLTASRSGDTLTLSRGGLELVLTDRRIASPDLPLQGTSWQLTGIRTSDSVSSVPSGDSRPTLEIAADGTVSLDTGCNRGRSTATVTGETMTFAPVTTTRAACADASARQTEVAVLAVLDGPVTWSVTERTLTLTRADRGLIYQGTP